MPMSTFLRNELRKHLFRTGSYTKPTVLAISLHTADPGLTGANEVAVGAYARVQRDPLDANWSAPSDGLTDNVAELVYPTPTANWGTVTHFGIWDALTLGNFLAGAALTTAKTINNGDPAPKFLVGALDVTLT